MSLQLLEQFDSLLERICILLWQPVNKAVIARNIALRSSSGLPIATVLVVLLFDVVRYYDWSRTAGRESALK